MITALIHRLWIDDFDSIAIACSRFTASQDGVAAVVEVSANSVGLIR